MWNYAQIQRSNVNDATPGVYFQISIQTAKIYEVRGGNIWCRGIVKFLLSLRNNWDISTKMFFAYQLTIAYLML